MYCLLLTFDLNEVLSIVCWYVVCLYIPVIILRIWLGGGGGGGKKRNSGGGDGERGEKKKKKFPSCHSPTP